MRLRVVLGFSILFAFAVSRHSIGQCQLYIASRCLKVVYIYVPFSQVAPARGAYTLQVKVLSYNNPAHSNFEGGCCDRSFTLKCGKCDAFFQFCARPYSTAASYLTCPTSSSVYDTPDSIPDSPSSYNFKTSGEIYPGAGVYNPLVFTGSSWLVSFLSFECPYVYAKRNNGWLWKAYTAMDFKTSDLVEPWAAIR